jgi:hypothetical protein
VRRCGKRMKECEGEGPELRRADEILHQGGLQAGRRGRHSSRPGARCSGSWATLGFKAPFQAAASRARPSRTRPLLVRPTWLTGTLRRSGRTSAGCRT